MNHFLRMHGLVGSMNKSRELELLRKIANMELYVEIGERAKFAVGLVYDKFDGLNEHSRSKMDMTKTTAVGVLEAGASTAEVVSVEGFKVGQEVTVYDDVTMERAVISAVGGTTMDFGSALVGSFKDGAGIARTNAEVVGGELVFGTWGDTELLECDVRYNFENTDGEISEVVTWIVHDATCVPDSFEVSVLEGAVN